MSDASSTPVLLQKRWVFALAVAAVQNAIALFAVYSSSQDVLSDGACIGGGYGTLANTALLFAVLVWAMVLGVKSYRDGNWHETLSPLLAVALSSTTAIFIGLNAALHCTV